MEQPIWWNLYISFEDDFKFFIFAIDSFMQFIYYKGFFPQEFKLVNAIPLNLMILVYHPVSLLSALSKGLWESSHVWLSYKLHRYLYDILFQYQCGLRKMHPSRMPFMVLMDKLIKSVDIGNCVIRVYLDFSWDYYRGTRNSAAGPWIISAILCAPARRCKQGAHYTYGRLWQH